DGWREVPVPSLGFGVAIPPTWEAVVLTDEALEALARSAPVVEGLTAAARNARAAGSLLYAAGQSQDGSVSDLKVRATLGSGIGDSAALRDEALSRAEAA